MFLGQSKYVLEFHPHLNTHHVIYTSPVWSFEETLEVLLMINTRALELTFVHI
ncbi:hypothetical protein X975_11284, partial [Stegodyphus mimosarum]